MIIMCEYYQGSARNYKDRHPDYKGNLVEGWWMKIYFPEIKFVAGATLPDESFNLDQCIGCFNCKDCTGCVNCGQCTDCTNCTNSYDCTDCQGCDECYSCTGCEGCDDCDSCIDCVGYEGYQSYPGSGRDDEDKIK